MSQPKPTREKRSGGKAIAIVIVAIVGLPVLYVLSIGPAAWLQVHGYMSPGTETAVEAFYAPLALAANNSEWVMRLLMAYMSLWIEM